MSFSFFDFLLFYWQNWYYPAFNVADSCITLGAILLILDEIQTGLGRTGTLIGLWAMKHF